MGLVVPLFSQRQKFYVWLYVIIVSDIVQSELK